MKIMDSVIYVVCTPDGTPIKAFTNEHDAKKYLLDQMISRGDTYSYEHIFLEIDDIFYKRLHLVANSIEVKKKKEDK